jgi:hypothetical protein
VQIAEALSAGVKRTMVAGPVNQENSQHRVCTVCLGRLRLRETCRMMVKAWISPRFRRRKR